MERIMDDERDQETYTTCAFVGAFLVGLLGLVVAGPAPALAGAVGGFALGGAFFGPIAVALNRRRRKKE